MDKLFAPAPAPKTSLGRYRVLGPHCGLRVSPLQLGAMSIGQAWEEFMGTMSKEESFKLLDAYLEAGGNFIDTANNYQNEESEAWLGEWAESRGVRDRIVIATKYTTNYKTYELGKNEALQYGGNDKRSLHMSVRDSLKKLRTDWIDILYLHWWDWTTSIKEVMDSLHILVEQGKVLYLGISDTPAWIVAAANQYALDNGKTPFVIYQGRWNVMLRDFERDIIPMCRQFGLALAPWDAIGSGRLITQKQLDERAASGEQLRRGGNDRSELEIKYSECLAEIAAEHGIESVTAVALAYLMAKTPYVFPIVGGRKIQHLHDNIQSLSIKLTQEQIDKIDSVQAFEHGFPHNFCGTDATLPPSQHQPQNFLVPSQGTLDYLPGPKPFGKA
ncbi:Putative aryl-alcohol dehydrogenase aad14 [Rhodotorula kratochvilovae]